MKIVFALILVTHIHHQTFQLMMILCMEILINHIPHPTLEEALLKVAMKTIHQLEIIPYRISSIELYLYRTHPLRLKNRYPLMITYIDYNWIQLLFVLFNFILYVDWKMIANRLLTSKRRKARSS